jgi:hypothetical protein
VSDRNTAYLAERIFIAGPVSSVNAQRIALDAALFHTSSLAEAIRLI